MGRVYAPGDGPYTTIARERLLRLVDDLNAARRLLRQSLSHLDRDPRWSGPFDYSQAVGSFLDEVEEVEVEDGKAVAERMERVEDRSGES